MAFISKDTTQKSTFLPFIVSSSGKRSEILRKSVVDITYENFSHDDIKKLFNNAFIMKADRPNCFSLTAKGLFCAEELLGTVDLDQLLNSIQNKYFNTFINPGKLDDMEKITLLTLIVSRSFSENTCMKVDTFSRENNIWVRIFQKSAEFLFEIDLISDIPDRISNPSENQEHLISFIMRHMNKLQEKTKNIYSFTRSKCYYISLDSVNGFSFDGLTFLFSKVFDRVLTYNETERITNFICRHPAPK